MKKNLALLLALAMLIGCMLGIAPAADATGDGGDVSVESYEPSIAYSNVNYTEDLVLMFAVPAPAEGALAEGSSVKVVLWTVADRLYRYSDANLTLKEGEEDTIFALEAEASKVTIGGVEHLVYKYNGLTPEKMTDIVYARPVVVDKNDKAIAYGEVIDYSIVEYVETAKGGFNGGDPVVKDEKVLGLLDSMLEFGAFTQSWQGEEFTHAPNGYLANDELYKVWVTPIVNGVKLDKVFGGFFKYVEDDYATVRTPFYDGRVAARYYDADGKLLLDANDGKDDAAQGFQVKAVEADIEITVEYDSTTYRIIDAANYGSGFSMKNTDPLKVYGQQGIDLGANWTSGWSATMAKGSTSGSTLNLGGEAGKSGTWYNGIKTVEYPPQSGNYVFQMTSSNAMYWSLSSHMAIGGLNYNGYGDTVDEAVTYEIEFGKQNPDDVVTINGVYFRDRSAWGGWDESVPYNGDAPTEAALKSKYGSSNLFTYALRVIENDVILAGNGAKICTLPDSGLIKVAITICGDNMLKAYYSNENGDMIYAGTYVAEEAMKMSPSYVAKHAKHLENIADNNPDNDDDLLPYADINSWLTMNTLETSMYVGPQGANSTTYKSNTLNAKYLEEFKTATVVIDGNTVAVTKEDGTYNPIALQYYMEQNYSFFMSYFKISVGDVYKYVKPIVSVTGEDFGEGFAISNLTDKIGIIDGDPAKLAAMGATHDSTSATPLNAYRFEKLFRRVWFDGNIAADKFFQGFKTVADPENPKNLVLQVTTGNRTTLDLETIKPEALANNGWGDGGAITLEFEIGQSNPNSRITTRVFQLSRRTDENPDAGLSGTKSISIFTITDNKVYFTGNNANAETLIGEIPTTGFAKVAFVIYDTGVIKAYFSDANGNMVYACEKDVSTYTNQLGDETFASWMNYVITTRWNIGENVDAATIQAATVEIDGATVPVYADGAYNEAALQVYMETHHSFLLDNFKIWGAARYE